MSKIKTLTVSNLKAVSLQTADFDGCTAIITAGNNKGKTSFLKSLFARCQGIKADTVLKTGETDGFAEATLTTGEKIKWEFNDKGKGFKEKLTYITDKDIKTPLTIELRNRFFPETFDVDSFLAMQPAKQRKVLQDLAGLDFTDIDTRYKAAYEFRTEANTRASDAKTLFDAAVVPVKVEAVISIDDLLSEKENVRVVLNKKYLENKKVNDDARAAYQDAKDAFTNNIDKWNREMSARIDRINTCDALLGQLEDVGYTGKEVQKFIDGLPIAEQHTFTSPIEPNYITELPDNAPLLAIEKKIEDAHEQNRQAAIYTAWLGLKTKKEDAQKAAIEANNAVSRIEGERLDLIKTANMPEGFSFTDEGIAYNGLAFTREQLSSSGIYIAALKLASMNLGEVRCLHFDASFLDNKSLSEIEKWATSQDLQLLIEMPDRSGGEITYQLIEQL